MSAAWLHLVLSHAPIFGCLAAAPMLILAEIRDSDLLRKLACWYLLAAAGAACGAYFTGPAAIESVFGPDQTGGDLVLRHALLGRIAFVGMILLGAAAGIALLQYVQDGRCTRWLRWTLILLVIAHVALLAATSHAGGKIRRDPALVSDRSRSERAGDGGWWVGWYELKRQTPARGAGAWSGDQCSSSGNSLETLEAAGMSPGMMC